MRSGCQKKCQRECQMECQTQIKCRVWRHVIFWGSRDRTACPLESKRMPVTCWIMPTHYIIVLPEYLDLMPWWGSLEAKWFIYLISYIGIPGLVFNSKLSIPAQVWGLHRKPAHWLPLCCKRVALDLILGCKQNYTRRIYTQKLPG